MQSLLTLFMGALALLTPAQAMKVAANLQWIEHTPQRVAGQDFYKGSTPFSMVSGGAASLFSDSSVDIGANSETQALNNFGAHKNLRIIYTTVEVTYRIVASKKKGIKTLADLKGKRIGGSAGSSSAYFVETMANTVGLKSSDYTLVSGNFCMASPCGSGTFPAMLKAGTIDAFGYWETAVQLAIDLLGDDAVVFGNASIYREVYNLHTTTEKLQNPAKRRDIVEYIRALNEAEKIFRDDPEKVYERVSKWTSATVPMLRKVWPLHFFRGAIAPDMLDVLEEQDKLIASKNRRQPFTRASLATMIDESVLAEANNLTAI